MAGKTIKIFLVEGAASGLRTTEIGVSSIKAVVVPRASLSNVGGRPELQKTGVYVLVGEDSDNPGKKKIYIGEGDVVMNRLLQHNKDNSKDFWEEAVVLISKDENLTKAHVRFVEARLISLADQAKRCTVANATAPTEQGRLPESDEADMNEYILQAMLLLGTLGMNILEPVSQPTPGPSRTTPTPAPPSSLDPPEFIFSVDGHTATCIIDVESGQFIVKQGSEARKDDQPSLRPTYKNLRKQLRDSGVLIEADNIKLKFSQSYAFSSASAAASVVSATAVNGRAVWRTRNGDRTFADWEDERLARFSTPQVAPFPMEVTVEPQSGAITAAQ